MCTMASLADPLSRDSSDREKRNDPAERKPEGTRRGRSDKQGKEDGDALEEEGVEKEAETDATDAAEASLESSASRRLRLRGAEAADVAGMYSSSDSLLVDEAAPRAIIFLLLLPRAEFDAAAAANNF